MSYEHLILPKTLYRESKNAENVKQAAIALLQPIKPLVKTITFDNGKEFSLHESIAEALGCNTYFARPYHSWERGHNENANGLLRQYFPKAMELVNVAMKQVFEALDKLNSRGSENAWGLKPLMRFLKNSQV